MSLLEVADWLVIRRRFDSYTVKEQKIVIQTATLELLPLWALATIFR
jgi:hypothetical protein